jgi:hypothetical protein
MIALQNRMYEYDEDFVFNFLWAKVSHLNGRSQLLDEDSRGWNVLRYFLDFDYLSKKSFDQAIQMYRNFTDPETIKKFLTKVYENGENVLFLPKTHISFVWRLALELLDTKSLITLMTQKNNAGKSFIVEKNTNPERHEPFIEETPISESPESLKLLMFVIEFYHYEFVKIIFGNIHEQQKVVIALSAFVDENNQTALTCAGRNLDLRVETYLDWLNDYYS